MRFQVFRKLLINESIHCLTDKRISQLRLCLSFKLHVLHLYRKYRGKSHAVIIAYKVLVLLLEHSRLSREIVEYAGKRRLESGLMHTAFGRGYVVYK